MWSRLHPFNAGPQIYCKCIFNEFDIPSLFIQRGEPRFLAFFALIGSNNGNVRGGPNHSHGCSGGSTRSIVASFIARIIEVPLSCLSIRAIFRSRQTQAKFMKKLLKIKIS
jgi:hypothetical protein